MRAAVHRFAKVQWDVPGHFINRHQIQKTVASMAIAIRNVVATS
jgi:hypothetical protein